MSFNFGSNKTNSTQTLNRTGSQTSMPVVPAWLQEALEGTTGRVMGLLETDPSQYVAGASDLQTRAFTGAQALGGPANGLLTGGDGPVNWQGLLGDSANMSALAGTAGPSYSENVNIGPASTAAMPTYSTTAPQATGASAGTGPMATGAGATGYGATAGRIAPARGYSASVTGGLPGDGIGLINVGDMAQAGSESLLSGLDRYFDPYLDRVVSSSMADFDDQAARDRNAMKAAAAKTGAFGGSRYGIAEGELLGQQERGRNTQLNNLLSESLKSAMGFSNLDTDRRQRTGEFNATQTNLGRLKQADVDVAGLGIGADLKKFDADALNEASRFGADAFNTGAIAQAGLDTDASIATAGNQTQASVATANNQTQAAIANLDAGTRAAIASADNLTQAAIANARNESEARMALMQAGVDVSRFNAEQINTMVRAAAELQQNNNQFNANQDDDALARMLEASGLLLRGGEMLGNQTRADLSLLGDLGETQRGITQEQLLAEPALLQAVVSLLGGLPLQSLIGEQTDTTETGTTTTRGRNSSSGFSFNLGDIFKAVGGGG